MKKKTIKKLELHRDTLRILEHERLQEAHGGATYRSDCNCPILSIGNCATMQWTNCTSC